MCRINGNCPSLLSLYRYFFLLIQGKTFVVWWKHSHHFNLRFVSVDDVFPVFRSYLRIHILHAQSTYEMLIFIPCLLSVLFFGRVVALIFYCVEFTLYHVLFLSPESGHLFNILILSIVKFWLFFNPQPAGTQNA